MGKLLALLGLFRKGSVVANPELWKHGGAALQAALVPFLLAIAAALQVFGVKVDISAETAAAVAGGVVAVVGVCVTYLTSDKVGLLPGLKSTEVAGPAGDRTAVGESHAPAPMGSGAADTGESSAVRPINEADREAP